MITLFIDYIMDSMNSHPKIINLSQKDTLDSENTDYPLHVITWLNEIDLNPNSSSQTVSKDKPIIETDAVAVVDEEMPEATDESEAEMVQIVTIFQPPYHLSRKQYFTHYTKYHSMYVRQYNHSTWARIIDLSLEEVLDDPICDCDDNDCEVCLSVEAKQVHLNNLDKMFHVISKSSSSKRMQRMIFIWNYVMEYGIIPIITDNYHQKMYDFLMMLKFVFPLIEDEMLIRLIIQLDADTNNYYFH